MKPEDIKKIRSEKKLNQSEFGDLIGVTKASVSRWENGIDAPSGGALKILEQLRDGDIVVSKFTDLEAKLLEQNVKASNYETAEDFLTASLKHILMHGEFLSIIPETQLKAHENTQALQVAEEPAEYQHTDKTIDPIDEANDAGGDSNQNLA